LVLRYGHSFEELAWAIIFILLPFACVYYPVSSLPDLMQIIAITLPTSHIFEAMRQILLENQVNFVLLKKIIILNFFYFSLSIFFFIYMIRIARIKGILMNQGE